MWKKNQITLPDAHNSTSLPVTLSPNFIISLSFRLSPFYHLTTNRAYKGSIYVSNGGSVSVSFKEILFKNGWRSLYNIRVIGHRDIVGLPRRGDILTLALHKFGPSAF